MLYEENTGKRRKDGKQVQGSEFVEYGGRQLMVKATGREFTSINLQQCFYGEHQLKGNNKPAALVESEKTAMIAALHYPKFNWLATGGKDGAKWLQKEVCKVLTSNYIPRARCGRHCQMEGRC